MRSHSPIQWAAPVVFWGALLGGLPACALLTKADPVVPRYFSPESSVPSTQGTQPAQAGASSSPSAAAAAPSLRLGRIGGSSYLKERIVFRTTAHEVGFYDNRRWTERPEVYLQRGLERAFFEVRGARRALTNRAPTLTADLVEFEEVHGPTPSVHVRVSYAVHDEQTVYDERSLVVDRPLASGDEATQGERAAAAFGEALREAVTQIADKTLAVLAAHPQAPQ